MAGEVVVVGVGSPFGGDRTGWAVIDRLAAGEPLPGVRLERLDRPGPALIPALGTAGRAVIVDAVRSGAAPGTLHRFTAADRLPRTRAVSGHGLGLADALALGERLGDLPPWVVIGVEAAPEALPPEEVLERAVRAVRAEAAAPAAG